MSETIGTAYIQIEPSTKGIKSKLNSEFDDAGSSAGRSFGGGFGSVIGGVAKVAAGAAAAGGAAVTKMVKDATDSFAEYEQLEGGAKLMFAEGYDYIAQKASTAFADVQMSQNDYLQQVNGLAVGLKTALGESGQAAAELADKVVRAEADVIAATGNSQEAVQNAFNGVMKSNFSMLDNLGLGITATKAGMQEVIDTVNKKNEEAGHATNYVLDNVADCQSALIDYIQMQGMAGYAADEGSKTIQGSLASMQGAWQNLMTGMASEGANIPQLVDNLVTTVGAYANNIIPVIETALQGIGTLIEKLAPVIASKLPSLVQKVLPGLLDAGVKVMEALLQGFLSAIPDILPAVVDAIFQLIAVLNSMLPQLIEAIAQILLQLAMGLADALPTLIPAIVESILTIIEYIIDNIDLFIDAIVQIMSGIAEGIIAALPLLVEKIPQIIMALVGAIIQFGPLLVTSVWDICLSVIKSVADAIVQILADIFGFGDTLGTSVSEICSNVFNTVVEWVSQLPSNLAYYAGLAVGTFLRFLYELPGKLEELWSKILQNMIVFGLKLVTEVPAKFKELKEKVIEAVKELPQRLLEIGKEIVNGLWNGIKNNWTNLVEGVIQLVNSFVGGIKKGLKIGSPSKVMEDEIGYWIPAGAAEGIQNGLGLLDEAVDDMTSSIIPDMNMGDVSSSMTLDQTEGEASDTDILRQILAFLMEYLPIIASASGNGGVDMDSIVKNLRERDSVHRKITGGQGIFA